jgi:hypothetical protein
MTSDMNIEKCTNMNINFNIQTPKNKKSEDKWTRKNCGTFQVVK